MEDCYRRVKTLSLKSIRFRQVAKEKCRHYFTTSTLIILFLFSLMLLNLWCSYKRSYLYPERIWNVQVNAQLQNPRAAMGREFPWDSVGIITDFPWVWDEHGDWSLN